MFFFSGFFNHQKNESGDIFFLERMFEDSLHSAKFWHQRDDMSCEDRAPKRIKSIHLRLLSENTIKKLAVCRVNSATLYDKAMPNSNSLNDTRMGTVDAKIACSTCKNDMVVCNGHIGYVELPRSVYHVAYIPTIVKVLRCICPRCFQLIVTKDDTITLRASSLPPKQRFAALTQHIKSKKACAHCLLIMPKIASTRGFGIERTWSEKALQQFEPDDALLQPLSPTIVKQYFQRVDNSIFAFLGLQPEFTHPRDFVLDVLLVPPPIIRPSIVYAGSSRARGQDDLTRRLQEILKTIQKFNASKEEDVTLQFQLLQAQVATYMNNESSSGKCPQSKKRSGAPEKSVVKRLKGKKGRCRSNLMGKRVNHCARAPISPDPNLGIHQLGVPQHIALTLTFPEHVTTFNVRQLQARVDIGFGNLKGAHSIETLEKQVISLEHCRRERIPVLRPGFIVHRYIQDGDYLQNFICIAYIHFCPINLFLNCPIPLMPKRSSYKCLAHARPRETFGTKDCCARRSTSLSYTYVGLKSFVGDAPKLSKTDEFQPNEKGLASMSKQN